MPTKVVFAAAGDIVVRNRLYQDGVPVHPGYERTMEYLRAGDVVWGSCEVQFSKAGHRTDAPIAYLVDPAVAKDLGYAGFNLMTVATNHTRDFGIGAFLDTLSHLDRAGIATVGGGHDLAAAQAPRIVEIGETKLGIIAVSCLLPPDYAAMVDRPGISPIRVEQWPEIHPVLLATEPGAPMKMRSRAVPEDVEQLIGQIERLRATVDVLIVSVHWGYGRGNPRAEYQQPLGRAIIDAGADMVLGNHPHSPAGIETYCDKPILYSLGNHIAQQDWANATPVQKDIFSQIAPWSMVCSISIEAGQISEIEFRATHCNSEGMPVLIDDADEAAPVLADFKRLSTTLGTEMLIDGPRMVCRFETEERVAAIA
ncbi:poly-gamma-glutamate synthesis protein (capsule biosynthesis protein) [Rhizobium subbaraonis]|uniref:Poly-gamma-glutamate synthesis protein (Capsule biosynthesis protein) n=1 Tax=Rhizobium subbaraonis TaxID=908946 RepID=A0A285V2B4_9HYPH|nr:CapA family protein [Rhizobium subbaraonis]SOC48232.1 poly-gamma-glutamate synthesis protein (capsule biosynthesis protein) [Rhizobium subbaraonis]